MAGRGIRALGIRWRPTSAATRSLRGLDWLNFFVANFQTGFGPFISVYLTGVGWTQVAIGAVLSIGSVSSMAGQVPAGMLVDWIANKRAAAAGAIVAITFSALAIATWPALLPIATAELVHAFASSVLSPAIAALSLTLVNPSDFGERLGRNARYGSIGNAFAAALMGTFGYYISEPAVFYLTAALGLPALAALNAIRATRPQPHRPAAMDPSPSVLRLSWRRLVDRRIVLFCLCAVMFHLTNAAMLPIAAAAVTKRAGSEAPLLIAACIVAPQIVTALVSPWTGRSAEHWGRRPILLIGFGALPLRGLLFAGIANPYLTIAIQLLDGISAAVFGVLSPLIVADISRDTGHYTTLLGIVGLAVGCGATLSTTAAGFIADRLGVSAAFLVLAAVGLCAILFVWVFMPETRPTEAVPTT
jgi:MFS family permease